MTISLRSDVSGNSGAVQINGTDRLLLDSLGALTASVDPATGVRSKALATMQKFADEFGSSLAANGYQKLPSGLIIQWGSGIVTPANNVAVNVTLPIAWTNGLLSGIANPAGVSANVGVFGLQATGGTSKTQITITQGGSSPQGTYFLAIGY